MNVPYSFYALDAEAYEDTLNALACGWSEHHLQPRWRQYLKQTLWELAPSLDGAIPGGAHAGQDA